MTVKTLHYCNYDVEWKNAKKMNSKTSGGRPAAVTQQRRSREADFSSLWSAEELEGPREFLWPGVAYLGGGCKF